TGSPKYPSGSSTGRQPNVRAPTWASLFLKRFVRPGRTGHVLGVHESVDAGSSARELIEHLDLGHRIAIKQTSAPDTGLDPGSFGAWLHRIAAGSRRSSTYVSSARWAPPSWTSDADTAK